MNCRCLWEGIVLGAAPGTGRHSGPVPPLPFTESEIGDQRGPAHTICLSWSPPARPSCRGRNRSQLSSNPPSSQVSSAQNHARPCSLNPSEAGGHQHPLLGGLVPDAPPHSPWTTRWLPGHLSTEPWRNARAVSALNQSPPRTVMPARSDLIGHQAA